MYFDQIKARNTIKSFNEMYLFDSHLSAEQLNEINSANFYSFSLSPLEFLLWST